jgi:hypothetical protein
LLAGDWLLTENRETAALAALIRLDITRLNEGIAIFTRFIKCVDGSFHIRHMSNVTKVNRKFGSLYANKHAETLMQVVSERFSRATDLSMMFACRLVMPVEQRYYSAVPWPGAFAASMEVMWRQCIDALAKLFSATPLK